MSPRFWPAERTLFTRTECPWGSAGDDRHSARRTIVIHSDIGMSAHRGYEGSCRRVMAGWRA